LKIPITKRAGRVAQGEGPEFKPQYQKKKKKKKVFGGARKEEEEWYRLNVCVLPNFKVEDVFFCS
jgi:hypothetical protein